MHSSSPISVAELASMYPSSPAHFRTYLKVAFDKPISLFSLYLLSDFMVLRCGSRRATLFALVAKQSFPMPRLMLIVLGACWPFTIHGQPAAGSNYPRLANIHHGFLLILGIIVPWIFGIFHATEWVSHLCQSRRARIYDNSKVLPGCL